MNRLATLLGVVAQVGRFVASVEGKHATTWTMLRHESGGDCEGVRWTEGQVGRSLRGRLRPGAHARRERTDARSRARRTGAVT